MNRARYNTDRVINLHMGGGRDSMTIACLLKEGRLEVEGLGADVALEDIDAIVFADTGAEWSHTYQAIERLRQLVDGRCPVITLAKADGAPTHGDRYTPADWTEIELQAAGGTYHCRPSIMADFQSRATVASLKRGDCTTNNKIGPLRAFMAHQHALRFGVKDNAARGRQVKAGEAQASIVIIGIAADELSRIEGNHRTPNYVEERYPLVTMGIAKADESPVLARHGLADLRKSGCFMCPYQPMSWYWALSVTEPQLWSDVVAYEAHALERNARMNVTGIKRAKREGGGVMRLPELVARWRAANPAATVDSVLDKQYSRCKADARAMRKAEQSQLADGRRHLSVVAA